MTDIREILIERGKNYGEFDQHACITQEIKEALKSGPSWHRMQPYQQEALEMVAHKLGRIVNGDPYYIDSYTDIVGYTQLVIDKLNENNNGC